MEFNKKKFAAANFTDRTEPVPVPEMARFFDLAKKEQPVWVVKGLTGEESAISSDAVNINKKIEAAVAAFTSENKKDITEGFRQIIGTSTAEAPDELIKRLRWLQFGSVEPTCDETLAVKMATNFPVQFFKLTNKIMELTGLGRLGE